MKLFKSHIRRTGLNRHPKAKLLALGGVLFSLGAVTSVTVTYAWYAINVMAQIDNLNVRIITKDYWLKMDLENNTGVTIKYEDRLDEEGNFTGFSLDDMDYDRTVGLNDVSGMYESDWNNSSTNPRTARPQFLKSYGASAAVPNKTAVATQGYLQTVLWLYANDNCEIYLTPDSGIVPNEEKNAETAREKGRDIDKLREVTNAVRLSFYSEDGYVIAKTGDSKQTYYGGVLDMNGDGYYDSYDGKEVLYGEYNTEALTDDYYVDPTSHEKPYEGGDTFTANHNPDVKQVVYDKDDAKLAIKKENSVKIDTLRYDETNPYKVVEPICKLKEGERKRVVFSVYCEGWDEYMTDAIESAAFNINLGFIALIKD